MKPLSEEELQMAAENDWSEYDGLLTRSFKGIFTDAYKLGYAKCVEQMQDEFNELLVACNIALRNQTKVDINEIINQMKGGNDE